MDQVKKSRLQKSSILPSKPVLGRAHSVTAASTNINALEASKSDAVDGAEKSEFSSKENMSSNSESGGVKRRLSFTMYRCV